MKFKSKYPKNQTYPIVSNLASKGWVGVIIPILPQLDFGCCVVTLKLPVPPNISRDSFLPAHTSLRDTEAQMDLSNSLAGDASGTKQIWANSSPAAQAWSTHSSTGWQSSANPHKTARVRKKSPLHEWATEHPP